jgi:hypothetical protein
LGYSLLNGSSTLLRHDTTGGGGGGGAAGWYAAGTCPWLRLLLAGQICTWSLIAVCVVLYDFYLPRYIYLKKRHFQVRNLAAFCSTSPWKKIGWFPRFTASVSLPKGIETSPVTSWPPSLGLHFWQRFFC